MFQIIGKKLVNTISSCTENSRFQYLDISLHQNWMLSNTLQLQMISFSLKF